MNQYMKKEMNLPMFYQYPKFLLGRKGLNDTDRITYMLLYDRARLSSQNGWVDDRGNVYVIYTIDALAKTMQKCSTVVKSALSKLEKQELIIRLHEKRGSPNKIFVLVPDNAECQTKSGQITQEAKGRYCKKSLNSMHMENIDYSFRKGESL